MSYFVGLSIATGFLTFYSSRDKISSEIESEKDKEATAESRRRDEFAMKFPSINKIPVIRKVVRWMYKEGWWYSALLLLILLIASGNIFVGLGDNDFFHDEQYHVAVVKSVLSGEGFRVWDYTINAPSERVYDSGYITNIFALISAILFGFNETSLRFFIALFGLFNIALVYFSFKDVFSKKVALITALAFSFNIISLWLSRFLRPYTFFLFFYLLSFLFLTKSLKFPFSNYKKGLLLFSWIIFALLAIEEREVGKILLIILPLCFLGFIAFNKNEVFRILKNNKTKIYLAIAIVLLSLITLNFLSIVKLSILPNQVQDFLSLSTKESSKIYYTDLLLSQIKNPNLGIVLFFLIIINSIFLAKYRFFERVIYFLIYALVPIFVMIYIFNKYEDFRYFYHIVPFFLGSIILSANYYVKIYTKKKSLQTAFLILAFLLLIYPVFSFYHQEGLTIKSPHSWIGDEGQEYLNGRIVAPEYKKVINALEKAQKSGDIVIIPDGFWHLNYDEHITYYQIELWNFSRDLKKGDELIDFFEFIENNKGKKMYYIGAYVHMIDPQVIDYLLKNCENHSEKLGILKFNYNSFYKNRFYWPNFYECTIT
jgi:hypothetical protein